MELDIFFVVLDDKTLPVFLSLIILFFHGRNAQVPEAEPSAIKVANHPAFLHIPQTSLPLIESKMSGVSYYNPSSSSSFVEEDEGEEESKLKGRKIEDVLDEMKTGTYSKIHSEHDRQREAKGDANERTNGTQQPHNHVVRLLDASPKRWSRSNPRTSAST